MRSTVQKILKEAQDYHSSVFLIMSEDEKFVKYNLHVGGEEYFSGGPNQDGWQSSVILDNKNFQEFYINKRQNAEGVISILPQPQLDRYKPKVVEYVMGFFRKDEMSNLFDQINESENTDIGSKHNPHRGDFLLSKKAIFVDGKDQATTVGNFYEIKSIRDEGGAIKTIFINDFDAPHTVTPTNDFFKEYFEYVPREYKDDINIDTSTLFESEEDEWEWAREALNDVPYIPSPNHNRMTVWVFNKDTSNPESKIKNIFDSLEASGFYIHKDDKEQQIKNVLNALRNGDDDITPYIRTRTKDTVHEYDGISSGSGEHTFMEVVSPEGFNASWVDVHHVQ